MSTDSQGRPLSDDGQWAWNGTEWVPAAGGPPEPEAAGAAPAEDVGATMIVQSPFPGGVPSAPPQGAAPQGAAPGSGAAPADYGQPQSYGQAAFEQQGYGQVPSYGPGAPGYGVPPQPAKKSRRPLILGAIGVLVIAAVVVVLVVTLGSSSKKSVTGAYSCTAAGRSGTGVITFKSGGTYTLNEGGTGGTFTTSGGHVNFTSGDLKSITGTLSNGNKTVTLTYRGASLVCKK